MFCPACGRPHAGECDKMAMLKNEREAKAKADYGLAVLDALADKWAAEVDLTSTIKNAVSPMRLNRNAPDDVREDFTHRMEVQIDAIARQAFIEGAYRAITGLQDERKEMKQRRIRKSNLNRAADQIGRAE